MNKVSTKDKTYLPAAGKDWLLPLYDPLTTLLGVQKCYHDLIAMTGFHPTDEILDVGCGTGSLVKVIKENAPRANVTGIDPDAKALAIAAKKLSGYINVRFDCGSGQILPYDHATFDHVLCSFVFHHMDIAEKVKMSREVRRVLKSGHNFLVMDFDSPEKCIRPSIPDILQVAGFHSVQGHRERHCLLGSIGFYSAIKSA